MKRILFLSLGLIFTSTLFAQGLKEVESPYNGRYHLLKAEKSATQGTTKKMTLQLVENNGKQMMAAVACEKCFPAVYSYQKEMSDKLGVPVFFNRMGLYLIGYDDNSFIVCSSSKLLGQGEWTKLIYINIYSKNQLKPTKIGEEKIKQYAMEISKKAIK